ncbi:MAG: anhydro-N-acetylmuramic acid kinase [SAR324 cluster bacterium]|uniref:Anhydro-N-acetylmuramic acid kinase n=1 Tax=SAR324 cluster bacterium TaxID=2024889 RepID=A0A7X9FR17_9DELT|nr:anhydro-N-acetylmuramic acid kinase [SAR324 cluster bacterium]
MKKLPGEILLHFAKKESRLVCGMMSGTSADSIDLAFCRIKGAGLPSKREKGAELVLQHFYSHKMPAFLADHMKNIPSLGVKEIAELDVQIAEAFAEAFKTGLEEAKLESDEVDFISSHGQTLYHHSRQEGVRSASLQLGNGDILSSRSGVPVISNFRVKDIAAGGEGAPLTPYADAILFKSSEKRRAVLNLGGIANITILSEDRNEIIGFDTGPANAPLDRLARILSDNSMDFDVDGKMASKGKVNESLLKRLLDQDLYLRLAPPKSTGFEIYGDDFVEKAKQLHGTFDYNLMATLLSFVVHSIHLAVETFVPKTRMFDELIIAGGGARNPETVRSLKEVFAPIPVLVSDTLGIPSFAREAMAFAILGNDAVFGLPTSLPSVTGAVAGKCLGSWSFPD